MSARAVRHLAAAARSAAAALPAGAELGVDGHHPVRHHQRRLLPGRHRAQRPAGLARPTGRLTHQGHGRPEPRRSPTTTSWPATTSSSATSPWSASPTRSAGPTPATPAGSACPLAACSTRPACRTAPTSWSAARSTAGPPARPTRASSTGGTRCVAFGMNGEPLPVEHGFPARLVVPGLYGYISATKWLTELELTTFGAYDAYWVAAGLGPAGPDQDPDPHRHAPRAWPTCRPAASAIGGVAWAIHRGIDRRRGQGRRRPLDAGPARRRPQRRHLAPVGRRLGRHARQPHASPPGRPTAPARCRPSSGPSRIPDGASGWHSVVVLCHDRPYASIGVPAGHAVDGRTDLSSTGDRRTRPGRPHRPLCERGYMEPLNRRSRRRRGSSPPSAARDQRALAELYDATATPSTASPDGCSPTPPWPRRSCRRSSCACGTSPSASTPTRGALRSFLLRQAHSRAVERVRSEEARRRREERHDRENVDPAADVEQQAWRAHPLRAGEGRPRPARPRASARPSPRLLRRPHLPRGRASASTCPRARSRVASASA